MIFEDVTVSLTYFIFKSCRLDKVVDRKKLVDVELFYFCLVMTDVIDFFYLECLN